MGLKIEDIHVETAIDSVKTPMNDVRRLSTR